MEMYIKSNHYRLWLIIKNGEIPITSPEAKWTNANMTITELNTKAHYTLTYALSRNEYNKIYRLKQIRLDAGNYTTSSLPLRLRLFLSKPPNSTNFTSYKYYVTSTFISTSEALPQA